MDQKTSIHKFLQHGLCGFSYMAFLSTWWSRESIGFCDLLRVPCSAAALQPAGWGCSKRDTTICRSYCSLTNFCTNSAFGKIQSAYFDTNSANFDANTWRRFATASEWTNGWGIHFFISIINQGSILSAWASTDSGSSAAFSYNPGEIKQFSWIFILFKFLHYFWTKVIVSMNANANAAAAIGIFLSAMDTLTNCLKCIFVAFSSFFRFPSSPSCIYYSLHFSSSLFYYFNLYCTLSGRVYLRLVV